MALKLDAGRFAIAVANVWAAAALTCAVFYKVAPDSYARVANFLVHTDMFRSTRVFGWGEVAAATVAWWVLVAVLAGASAAAYNRAIRT